MRLTLPPCGVVLGYRRDGTAAAFPVLVPTHATRVGVAGGAGPARVLTAGLRAAGCEPIVVTNRAQSWPGLMVTGGVRNWPDTATQPPWALVIDMPEPPPVGLARAPWSTVVHVCDGVPGASGWWCSADLILTTAEHLSDVLQLRPHAAQPVVADGEIVAVGSDRAIVFRPVTAAVGGSVKVTG